MKSSFFLLANLFWIVVESAPCDIFSKGETPCVAAHSMIRALYNSYSGSIYQLKRGSDNTTRDIGVLSNGFADVVSHEAFCSSKNIIDKLTPSSATSNSLPSIGSIITLTPVSLPGYRFRHCYSQGFVTPFDYELDHSFYLVNALNNITGSFSFQSVNYPTSYISPIQGAEVGRVGITENPNVNDASWILTPTSDENGFMIISSNQQLALTIGNNITGNCANSYKAPSASVYLLPQSSVSNWYITATEPAPLSPNECVVWKIYDQTGNGNDMVIAGPALNNPEYDAPVNASRHPLFVGGNKVYGAQFEGGMGYRAVNTKGVATGNDPETIYMVTSGKDYDGTCCFDYGNSENVPTDPSKFCDGCMEALYFGEEGGWCGQGNPTALADLENGLWGCDTPNGNNPNLLNLNTTFVTAMLKGRTDGFSLKGGDATMGVLTSMWDGPRPPGYQPMHKTGGIILGVGGDNVSRRKLSEIPGTSVGIFYEGALTSGVSSDETDALLQQDIINAGYGLETTLK
jgi:non-reducing end alpha-L-arabinofuranosidase